MCGICGTTGKRGPGSIEAMNAQMVHRGPDDSGVSFDARKRVGLGARRLKVIDLAGGHQPLANEDGTVWAVLNGEIYNFRQLRETLLRSGHTFKTHSDTEVLVHLYEEHGDNFVHELEGMYAFAVWDGRRNRLVVVRDRFGEKPLFYAQTSTDLTFASELTALLAGIDAAAEPNLDALDAYFIHGYVPGEDSVAHGIRQLRPGHRLIWDGATRSVDVDRYWKPPERQVDKSRTLGDTVDQAAELLDRAVASRMIADVPLGVFLSGGIDSTLISALAVRHAGERLKTFTVDYDVGEVGERTLARSTAATLGTSHHELVLTTNDVATSASTLLGRLDQPIADPAIVALAALSECAKHDVTVAVGGEGADELFCGYPRYRWLARSSRVAVSLPARLSTTVATLPGLGRLQRVGNLIGPGTTLDRNLAWIARIEARSGVSSTGHASTRARGLLRQRARQPAVT